MTPLLLSAFRIAGAVYLGLCLLLMLRQSRYVYHPDRTVSLTPDRIGLAYEALRLKTEDGETLAAWWIPAQRAAPTLLFFHGNAGDIGDRLGSIRTFHDMGLNVLIFDYRGYGESTGKPSEPGTYADAMAAWTYLNAERGIPPSRIVVFGRSLGGAVASWLAARVDPGALILESTFTSAPAMAHGMFPFLPTLGLEVSF